jgi:hypothetical protein
MTGAVFMISGRVPTTNRTSDEVVTVIRYPCHWNLNHRYLHQLADLRIYALDRDIWCTIASEYERDGGRNPWRTLLLRITQTGETADTLSALRRCG